ncbi:MAG: hypothetical protein KDB68_11605 [Planctomycetes bacterium]|nr:hypothetical protein [Planctomycetota bacterium]
MSDQYAAHYQGFVRQYMERVETYLENLKHAGQKGTVAERAAAEMLADFLPRKFVVEHDAVLVDRKQELSPQCDLAIYNAVNRPRMFPMRGASLLPVDLCAAVVEVKARATKKDVLAAFEHADKVKRLDFNQTVIHSPRHSLEEVREFRGLEEAEEMVVSTQPPVHVVWCWQTTAKTIRTAHEWIVAGMKKQPSYEYLPDLIVFLDKGLLWSRTWVWNGRLLPGQRVDRYIKCSHFIADDDDATAVEVVHSSNTREPERISQGKAALFLMWTLLDKVKLSEATKLFRPDDYIPDTVGTVREWPIGGTFSSR